VPGHQGGQEGAGGQSTQPQEHPRIELVERDDGEVTLLIDGRQAMQAWERDLMWASADLLCGYGSRFLEVGLGLGISALRIAGNPGTCRHTVVEKYREVIDLFLVRHTPLPSSLEIVEADFVSYVGGLEPGRLDGIFFDPFLPAEMNQDEALWREVVPAMVRSLRPGGVLIPFATSRPVLRWQFVPYFDRVIVERRNFSAYATTEYMSRRSGPAYIQCFIKTEADAPIPG
jgi:predicted methyltransferase